jgi:DNA-binding beta-propeller fold protein YncE
MKRNLIARIFRHAAAQLCVLALAGILGPCAQPSDSTPAPQTGALATTLAGKQGVAPGSEGGTGAAARFYFPWGITTDGTNLYVAGSENNKIRQIVIDTAGVTTLAGKAYWPGSDDGTGVDARFTIPHDLTTDGTNLYVADTQNKTIRVVTE